MYIIPPNFTLTVALAPNACRWFDDDEAIIQQNQVLTWVVLSGTIKLTSRYCFRKGERFTQFCRVCMVYGGCVDVFLWAVPHLK